MRNSLRRLNIRSRRTGLRTRRATRMSLIYCHPPAAVAILLDEGNGSRVTGRSQLYEEHNRQLDGCTVTAWLVPSQHDSNGTYALLSGLMSPEFEELRYRLRRYAGQVTRATELRDQAIGDAYEAGLSMREIARIIGWTHPGVRRVLIRDGRTRADNDAEGEQSDS